MMDDARHMLLALDLARKGLGTTSPNPMVGAVAVSYTHLTLPTKRIV